MDVVYESVTLDLMSGDNSTTPPPAGAASSWGPKRDPLAVVVPVTVVYALIFLLGVVGNVSTCVVIARNKHMHTATNYYLFSLAVSDLLLLVSGLPPEMYYIWSRYPYVFGEPFCMLQGFAAETSANATVLTITAFTVERYVAICHPFQSHVVSKLSRAIKFIFAIWVLALCLAVPQAMQLGLVSEKSASGESADRELTVCAVARLVIPHSFEISSLLFFVAPMTLITVLYVLIGLRLRGSSVLASRVRMRTQAQPKRAMVVMVNATTREECEETDDCRKNFARNAHNKATKHVVKMLVAVVVAFFICWAPFHAQRLLAVYGSEDERPSPVMVVVFTSLTYVSGILYYVSTTINPFLYHIMSHKFREAFKDTLARYLRRRRRRGGRWHCYSVLSGRLSNNNSSTCNNSNGSNASSLRYLEADMARLHANRRPIVVSFRRPALGSGCTLASTPDSAAEVYVSLEEARSRATAGKKTAVPNRCTIHRHLWNPGVKDTNVKPDLDFAICCTPNDSPPYGSVYGDAHYRLPCPEETVECEFPIECNFPDLVEDSVKDEALPLYILPKPPLKKFSQNSFQDMDSTGNTHHSSDLLCSKSKDLDTLMTQGELARVEDIEIFQEHHLKIESSLNKRMHQQKRRAENDFTLHNPQTPISSSVECCELSADVRGSLYDTSLASTDYIQRSSTMPCFKYFKACSLAKNSVEDSLKRQSNEIDKPKLLNIIYDINNITCNNNRDGYVFEHNVQINNDADEYRLGHVPSATVIEESDNSERIVSDSVNNNNHCFARNVVETNVNVENAKDQMEMMPTESGHRSKYFLPQYNTHSSGNLSALNGADIRKEISSVLNRANKNFKPKSCFDLREDFNTTNVLDTKQYIITKDMHSSTPKLFMYDLPQMLPQAVEN